MSDQNEAQWAHIQENIGKIRGEISKVVIGQEAVVESLLVALLCKGHCLIVGVPGLAKTLLVNTLAQVLGLSFHRIQFTPDLMPSDILGSEILKGDGADRSFQFVRGPIFANMILADEINRTPPKTQSALLEAMQEKQVTAAGKTMRLEEPFIVIATQNPIEQEGTYPLPEAQLDRFFFQLNISYPSLEEERQLVRNTSVEQQAVADKVLDADTLRALQKNIYDVPLPDNVLDSILKLVTSSRPDGPNADDFVKKYVSWGAGPRAAQTFSHACRALAILRGHPTPSIEEVRDLSKPILHHRVIPNYNATGEGIGVDQIIEHLVDQL